MLLDFVVVGATLAALLVLRHPLFRKSEAWRATVTPLASIIGSGFLVVAPLLAFTVGYYAVFAMAALVVLAYLVGAAIRYNILFVEDNLNADGKATAGRITLLSLERISKVLLAVAYVIAVTFYLELLGAFLLRGFGIASDYGQKILATGFALFIGLYGTIRGLSNLERVEKISVNALLAIIAGFLVALLWRNFELFGSGRWVLPDMPPVLELSTVYKLMGAFLIVQGFETSRYLGDAHSPDLRARTMRWAQLIVIFIYVVFIGAVTVFMEDFRTISETGIINLAGNLAVTLSILLVLGAVLSQFSSAVADIIGSGGLISEASDEKIKPQWTYLAVAALVITLDWSADIFAIITYASRAFALFYGVQCVIAALCSWSSAGGGWLFKRAAWPGKLRAAGFALLALAMLAIAALGVPATH